MREIVFDTETTGLDPSQGDRIVEIGCIELVNRCETGRTFHAYFNPQMAMPSIAEQIHGLSDTFLTDKPLSKTLSKTCSISSKIPRWSRTMRCSIMVF